MADAAAKEPTMEDILSSIRKIIADEGDVPEEHAGSIARKEEAFDDAPRLEEPAAETMPEPVVDENVVSEPIPVAGSLAQIAAGLQSEEKGAEEPFRPLNTAPPVQPEASVQDATMESRSLADIAAAVKAMEHNGEPQQEEEAVAAHQPPVMPEETAAEPVFRTPEPALQPVAAPIAQQPISEQEATYIEMSEAISPPSRQMAPAPEPDIPAEEAEFKGALMSPGADGAVASSFERLKRSMMDDLDAKTESIMRPLLREWLDENLPNMVERLVREEIERVARG